MAGLIGKIVFNRILKETRENNQGRDEDPYFETVPTKKLSVATGKPGSRTKLKKRRKALPPGLSEEDQQILVKVKRRAYRLDMALGSLFGIKLGWGSVIGIIPGIGDVIDALLALMVIRTASQADLPSSVLIRMLFNVALDFVVGLVPFLGDLADMAYKANTRNAVILEDFLRQRGCETIRESGLPPQYDPSLADVVNDDDESDDEDRTQSGPHAVRKPRDTYAGPKSKYTGNRRDFDVEAQNNSSSSSRGRGSSSAKQPHRGSSKHNSRDKKRKPSKGHTRLDSQETGTL